MVRHGFEPLLECSSKGDKRFSAFYARLKKYNDKSIEEIYQASKVFEDGSTGLLPKQAKGRIAVNMDEVRELYESLWDIYFEENPELLNIISNYNGFSDIFGQERHACQATSIYRIWVKHSLRHLPTLMIKYKDLVVNKRKTNVYDMYCGRGSIFGNPYSHLPKSSAPHKTDTVEQAIAHCRFTIIYRMNNEVGFNDELRKLKGKTTACYCSSPDDPKPCHCFILHGAASTL